MAFLQFCIYIRHVQALELVYLLRKMVAIIIGSLLFAVGINFFLVPYKLLDGGIVGIALIINYIWDVKTGLIIILISIPIFILSWFHYRHYFYNSLHGMLISSFMVDIVYPYRVYFTSIVKMGPFSSAVCGGILVGAGIGLMLRHETSTGGTDLLAQFEKIIFSINVGIAIFIIDAIVISTSGLLFSKETLVLSSVTILAVGLTTSLLTWIPKKTY